MKAEQPMPIVEEAMHMGILLLHIIYRERDVQCTASWAPVFMVRMVWTQIRTIHLLQTYFLPVLVYGLEVLLPEAALVEKLERTYQQFIKHYLPTNHNG